MKALILSDIHGNLAALKAVLAAEADADEIVCLGDLVDYGPQPVEAATIIRSLAQIVVQGNHDYAVGNDADPQCSPAYKHLAKVTQDYSASVLSADMKDYLARLPRETRFELGGAHVTAVHAAPSDPLFKYRPPDTPDETWLAEIVTGWSPDLLLLGHTHLPMERRAGQTLIVNPGSVGQPKDGDPRAAYAVWQDGEAALRRVEYDVELTVEALQAMDLAYRDGATLAHILRTGGD